MAATAIDSPPIGDFFCVSSAWRAHEAELRAFLRHRSADTETAEDVLQDVFLKALSQGRAFCEIDNPRAWLFKVARHALIDRHRAAKPHASIGDDSLQVAEPDSDHGDPVDALSECLVRVLNELSADDADILRACDLSGHTLRQFADQHHLSLPAAKSRLLRARQRLRSRMVVACQISFDADGRVGNHVPRAAGST